MDGYGVYEDELIGGQPGVILMHCMAHGRRGFEKSLTNDKLRAEYFLKEMRILYAIEQRCRDEKLDAQQIFELRQVEAKPILERIGQWLKEKKNINSLSIFAYQHRYKRKMGVGFFLRRTVR